MGCSIEAPTTQRPAESRRQDLEQMMFRATFAAIACSRSLPVTFIARWDWETDQTNDGIEQKKTRARTTDSAFTHQTRA